MKVEVDVSQGIEVASFHYEVKQGKEIERDLEADTCYGKCDNQNHQIKITRNYSGEQFSSTFIHECIEAVNTLYCNNQLKHPQIVNLGNGLAQILKSLGIQFIYGGKKDGNNRRDDKKEA